MSACAEGRDIDKEKRRRDKPEQGKSKEDRTSPRSRAADEGDQPTCGL